MKPYFSENGIQIYLGNSFEIVPELNSVDILVTDPPYGVNWQSNSRRKFASYKPLMGDDGSLDIQKALSLFVSVLKKGRHAYVFGQYDLSKIKIGSSCELIWDKGTKSGGHLSLPWGKQHETITFFTADNKAPGNGGLSARIRKGSIIRCPRVEGTVSLHPTQKPVQLLREIIESSSCFGETVLDPFAGSCSTLLAAKMEDRKAIGVELDEKYAEIGAKRLQAYFQKEYVK